MDGTQRSGSPASPWLRAFGVLSFFTPTIGVIWSGGGVPLGWFVFVQIGAIGLAATQWILAASLDRTAKLQKVIADKLHVYVND